MKRNAVSIARREALFEDVFMQLHRLHGLWRMYVTFFGTRHAVDTVRRHAPFTFGHIQGLLIEAIVLSLDKLLEVPIVSAQSQASVAQLILWLPPQDAATARALRTRLHRLRSECASVSAWRNRRIGHRDLAVALEEDSLDAIQTKTVRRAIGELSEILTVFSTYHSGMDCKFDPDLDGDAFDADIFLARLTELPDSGRSLFPSNKKLQKQEDD